MYIFVVICLTTFFSHQIGDQNLNQFHTNPYTQIILRLLSGNQMPLAILCFKNKFHQIRTRPNVWQLKHMDFVFTLNFIRYMNPRDKKFGNRIQKEEKRLKVVLLYLKFAKGRSNL